MAPILAVFVVLLLAKLAAGIWLDLLNLRHVRAHAGAVPESFRDFIDLADYEKSIEYTTAKTGFGIVRELFDSLVLAVVLLSGLLAAIYTGLSEVFGYGIWGQALVLFVTGIALGLTGLPFDWWSTFKLEERFGFNKSTLKLWWTDKIKGLLIVMKS